MAKENQFFIKNLRTGKKELVTQEQQESLQRSVYKRNFKYLTESIEVGKASPKAKSTKKGSENEK